MLARSIGAQPAACRDTRLQAGVPCLGSLAGCCMWGVCRVRVLGASAGLHADVARCAGDKHVRRVRVAF